MSVSRTLFSHYGHLVRGLLRKGGDLAGRRVRTKLTGRKVAISGQLVAQFVTHTRIRNVIYDNISGKGGTACTLLRRHIPPMGRLAGSRTLTALTLHCFHDRSPTDLASFM